MYIKASLGNKKRKKQYALICLQFNLINTERLVNSLGDLIMFNISKFSKIRTMYNQ